MIDMNIAISDNRVYLASVLRTSAQIRHSRTSHVRKPLSKLLGKKERYADNIYGRIGLFLVL